MLELPELFLLAQFPVVAGQGGGQLAAAGMLREQQFERCNGFLALAALPGMLLAQDGDVDTGDHLPAHDELLVVEFDGQQTVWCPVGDLFGSGVGLNPFRGWWRRVSKDGRMRCRWVMPFEKACRVRLVNLGEQEVKAALMYGASRVDAIDIVEAVDQARQRRFARPTLADHRDLGPRRDLKIQSVQDSSIRLIAKPTCTIT